MEQGLRRPLAMSHFFQVTQRGKSNVGLGGVCSFLFVEVVGGSGLAEDFSATARRLLLLFILAPAATNNCGSGIFVQRTINSKMPGEALRTLRWLSRSPGGFFARPETTTVCVSQVKKSLRICWADSEQATMSFYVNYEIHECGSPAVNRQYHEGSACCLKFRVDAPGAS